VTIIVFSSFVIIVVTTIVVTIVFATIVVVITIAVVTVFVITIVVVTIVVVTIVVTISCLTPSLPIIPYFLPFLLFFRTVVTTCDGSQDIDFSEGGKSVCSSFFFFRPFVLQSPSCP
jgi:hypothetical protein